MKNKIRFGITILIALSLALGMLTGCKESPSINKTTPTLKYSLIPTASPQATVKPFDLNGREIRIFNSYMYGDGITPLHNIGSEEKEFERITRIENEYNCKIVYLDKNVNTDEVFNSFKTNNPLADIVVQSEWAIKFIDRSGGEMIPLLPLDSYSKILDLNNMSLWNVEKQKFLAYGGSIDAVVLNNTYKNFYKNDVMFFNKSMLERAGLWDKYNLYDMQKNKTWNWDVFKKLCQQVSNNEQKGIFFSDNILNSFATSNGDGGLKSSIIAFDKNNSPEVRINNPSQKAALDLLLSLNSSGSLRTCKDYSSWGGKKYLQPNEDLKAFSKGKDLFTVRMGEFMFTLDDMMDEWGVVALPLGPDNTTNRYFISNSSNGEPRCMGIIKNTQNPEELVPILRELAPPPIPEEDMIKVITDELASGTEGYDTRISETYNLLSQDYSTIDYKSDNLEADAGFYLYITKTFQGEHSIADLYKFGVPAFQKAVTATWKANSRKE